MKKTFMSLLAVGLLLGASSKVQAQDEKPIAVISITSYDELMADLNFVGKLAEQPDLATNLEGMLKLFTQGQGLNGLNKKMPWGVAVTTDGMNFRPVAFVPVTDLKRLLTSLSGIAGEAGKPDAAGIIEINSPQGQTVYVKEQGGWAYISNDQNSLGVVPSDPLKLLADLPKSYDLAVRGHVQNIPEQFRELALTQVRAGVQMSLDRRPDEGDAEYAMRKKFVENQVESIDRIFNEADTFTLGWQINRDRQTTHLDFSLTALPDTRLANQMNLAKNAKTTFGGFVQPGAAITGNMSTEIAKEDVEDVITQLETLRSRAASEIDKDSNLPNDEARDAVKDVLDDFIDVLVGTVKSGRIDSGLAVMLEPKATKLIGGAYIADGKQLEAAVKKLVALAENEPNFPGVKFNAESYKGIRFHRMVVPVPEEDGRRVLGDQLEVNLGIADKAMFVAAGAGSMDAVKKAIDNSTSGSKSTQPVRISVALGAIMKFAAAMEENPMAQMLAAELEKVEGQDHLLITAEPIQNGITYRIMAEEGVLKVLGQASRMSGAQAGAF